MGYISFKETEPFLFEAVVRDNAKRGEDTRFRVSGVLEPSFFLIQYGPGNAYITAVVPPTLDRIGANRIETCMRIYQEYMNEPES